MKPEVFNEKILKDTGIQKYFAKIYAYVATNISITSAVSYGMYYWIITCNPSTALVQKILYANLAVIFVLPFVLFLSINSISTLSVFLAFLLYGTSMGICLCQIFFIYEMNSILYASAITAGLFFSLSIYAHYTETDFSQIGSTLRAGILMVFFFELFAYLFSVPYNAMIISAIIIFLMIGFILFNTQKLAQTYYLAKNKEELDKISIIGALNIYSNILNLFIEILRMTGKKKK